MAVKYVFVTGGVVSGLGKGITAASLGRLLKARGYQVTMQKFDPYINVDPGTMNPIQHGEVFVTDDGTETDLDLGHYERFIDESLDKNSNVTTGKIYWSVLQKERHGDYGGGTVQVIPHITNEIKSRFYRAKEENEDRIAIIEVGGTVGDIESQPFLEAIRQFQHDVGHENAVLVHVTLIPYLKVENWNEGMVNGVRAVCQRLDGSMVNEDTSDENEVSGLAILLAIIGFIGVASVISILAVRASTRCPQCGKHKLQRTGSTMISRRNGVKVEDVTYTCRNCGHTVVRRQQSYDNDYHGGGRGGGGPFIGGFGGGSFSGGGGGFSGGSFGGGMGGGGGAGSRF